MSVTAVAAAKKILVVGAKQSGKLTFVQSLTGTLPADLPPSPCSSSSPVSSPVPEDGSTLDFSTHGHGGLTHTWTIENTYYSALVDIWIEELASAPISHGSSDGPIADVLDGGLEEFVASYTSPEARGVRDALNVVVVTFRHRDRHSKPGRRRHRVDGDDTGGGGGREKPTHRSQVARVLDAVKRVLSACAGREDMLALAVGVDPVVTDLCVEESGPVVTHLPDEDEQDEDEQEEEEEVEEDWEDLCLDRGFEYINLSSHGKNEFGESQGIERAREAMSACDWRISTDDDDDAAFSDEGGEEDDHYGQETSLAELMAEDELMNRTLLGTDALAHGLDPEEASIEDLEQMMQRVMMARGRQSPSSLPPSLHTREKRRKRKL